MSIALTVTDHWSDTKRIHVVGTLAFSGNYATGGVAVSFADIKIKSASPPVYVAVSGLSKYLYLFNYATGKLKNIVPDTGVEVSAAAYPAGITGDTVTIYAIFPKFV